MTVARSSIDPVASKFKKLLPSMSEERCLRALHYAHEAYGDRPFDLMEGVTLLEHAIAVAERLLEFCPDEDAMIACILQHVLRSPEHALKSLEEEFGRSVRDIVSRVHLLSHLHTSDWRKSIDDMKIMLVSVSDDIRILLIALTIECYSMEKLNLLKPEFRSQLCRQSLQLFAPVAARLGIYAIKYRLELAAFPECYPVDATHILDQLKQLHDENGIFLDKTVDSLHRFFAAEGMKARILAREKQPYSIFQKMQSKSVTGIGKISDLFAIRVIVPTVADCYQVLGLLHRIGTPISHRFKDYISFPKPNGYQSLHTSLLGLSEVPQHVMIEVQIRTPEMHREAEYGVAAHWLYKEQGSDNSVLHSANQLHLSDVLYKQQSIGNTSDIDGESGASMHLVDHIYVLTPRGDIIELPEGGTPLDFAFLLHTDLGLKFKSARVNGSIVPISHKLENGDVVEIQTHKHARPSLQWLEELMTPSARSKLKAYFFSHNRSQFLQKGRDSVNAELKTRGVPQLDNDLTALHEFDGKEQTVRQREDLLVKVGMGSIRCSSILRHLPMMVPRKLNRVSTKTVKKQSVAGLKSDKEVLFEDKSLQMPYRFAKCCGADTSSPKPASIVGIITRAGIVSVHRDGCGMAKSANSERKVRMKWA